MHDPFVVSGVQRVDDVPGDPDGLSHRNRAAPQPRRQCLAHDELEHEAADALGFFRSINRADVRVIQGRQHTGLALEARQPLGMVGKRAREDLDGHVAPELRVARAVHLAHAAGADARLDLIGTEPATREDRR